MAVALATLVSNAAAAEKTATALTEQEKAARSERERLSGEAKAKLDAARSAQASLARQVAEEQRHGTELTAQLATLKGTTAAMEGEYRQGQAALAAYEAAQAAKRAAAEEQARGQAEAAAKAAAAAARQPQEPAPRADPAQANPAQPGPAPGAVNDPAVSNPGPPAPEAPAPAPPSPPAVVVPSVPDGAVNDPAGAKSYASGRLPAYGWGQDQFVCLAQLWTEESDWLTTPTNAYSGAYGFPRPCPRGSTPAPAATGSPAIAPRSNGAWATCVTATVHRARPGTTPQP